MKIYLSFLIIPEDSRKLNLMSHFFRENKLTTISSYEISKSFLFCITDDADLREDIDW